MRRPANVTMLGGVITAVLSAMLTPDLTLRDFSRYEECKLVDPTKPYPLDLYLDLVDFIGQRLSRSVVLKIGRSVGRQVIKQSLSKMKLTSTREAIGAIQQAHEQFCKPTIGEFQVIDGAAEVLQVRYTAPYDCVLQEGLFYEIANTFGSAYVDVRQVECRERGQAACLYEIRHSGSKTVT